MNKQVLTDDNIIAFRRKIDKFNKLMKVMYLKKPSFKLELVS
jgi:hypothetical protein